MKEAWTLEVILAINLKVSFPELEYSKRRDGRPEQTWPKGMLRILLFRVMVSWNKYQTGTNHIHFVELNTKDLSSKSFCHLVLSFLDPWIDLFHFSINAQQLMLLQVSLQLP